jgi:hypothetical protein
MKMEARGLAAVRGYALGFNFEDDAGFCAFAFERGIAAVKFLPCVSHAVGFDISIVFIANNFFNNAANIYPAFIILGVEDKEGNIGIVADVFGFAAAFDAVDQNILALPREPNGGIFGLIAGRNSGKGGGDRIFQQVFVTIGNDAHDFAPVLREYAFLTRNILSYLRIKQKRLYNRHQQQEVIVGLQNREYTK